MQFRVGLNLGDVIVEGDNLYGDGVNIAARLEATAEPGGICVSGKFYDEVRRKLDLNFVSKGAQEMKNIEEPVPTFMVEISSASKVLEAFAQPSPAEPLSSLEPNPTPAEEAKVPAIAVLPFTNIGDDPEQEFFADGITEDITTNLSLWRTFPVISRNSSFTFRGQSQNLRHVAGELGARYIVEGSVRKGGNRVRITAQLIDAKEDHHLWSERWDRSLDDIFEVQDEVSSAIAALVSPAVKGQEQDRVIRKPTKNLNAWDEYLRGLAILNSDGDLEKAKAHGYKSIELDPRLSDAYILVGQCLRLGELYNPEKQDQREAIETEFHEKAKKAFELDPKNPEALIILSVSANIKRNFEQRAELMKKALAINPNHAVANHEYGLSITAFGEFEKAKQHVLKSIELNPTSANQQFPNIGLMLCYLGLRDFDNALDAVDKVLEITPDFTGGYGFKASILAHLDRLKEAQALLVQYQEKRPEVKTTSDYEKVAPTIIKDVLLEGMIKAGLPAE